MTRQLSDAAQVAKIIRTDLKKRYPAIKFRVKSSHNSVDVYWTDGPKEKDISQYFGIYRYGDFDGMRDLYINSNIRKDIPQVKWLSFIREISDQLLLQAFEELKTYQDILDGCESLDSNMGKANYHQTACQYLSWRLSNMNLEKGFSLENYKKEVLGL